MNSVDDEWVRSTGGIVQTDRENRSAGGIPVTVTLCPPQNLHGLIRDQTRVSAVRGRPAGRRLTDGLSHGTATAVAIISPPKQHTLLLHLAGACRNVRVHSEMAHTKYRPNTAVQGRAPQLDISAISPSTGVLGLSLRGQHCSTLALFLYLLLPWKQRQVFEHALYDLLYAVWSVV